MHEGGEWGWHGNEVPVLISWRGEAPTGHSNITRCVPEIGGSQTPEYRFEWVLLLKHLKHCSGDPEKLFYQAAESVGSVVLVNESLHSKKQSG